MLAAAGLFLGLGGCEGSPARSRPWRVGREVADDPAAAPEPREVAERRRLQEEAAHRALTLRVALEVEPRHLNPMVEPDTSVLRVALDTVFETLLRHEPSPQGGPARMAPGLAASWRVTPAGTEIRVHLREDAEFHDGKPLTAVDAQFSLDRARGSLGHAPRLQRLLASVTAVEIWGPRDLNVVLRRPDAYVLRALAEVPILPAHVYGGGSLDRHPRNRTPVGTGPYRFVRWEKGARIVLARNETYWGRAPAIEEVEFLFERDAARTLLLARRGGVDVIPALIPQHHPEQASAPGLVESFGALRLRPAVFHYVALNARRPPFDDVRVRRAAAMLVDRVKIAREIHDGLARAVAGPIWPGGPGDGAAPEPPPFDPVAAAALLEQAGWRDLDGDGVRERDGVRLGVVLLALTDVRGDAERDLVVSGLRRAGFLVDLRPGEPAVLQNRLRAGEFDAAMLTYRGRQDDDLAPLLATGGADNHGGFSSPAVDEACARLAATWEPAGRAPRAGELARLLAEEAPLVALTAPDPFGLVHRRVKGLVVHDGWFAIREMSLEASPASGAGP